MTTAQDVLAFWREAGMGKWFGGGPAVWTTCMLFFQLLLLGGYAYAHALGRLALRRQAMVHVGVLLLAALSLPIALAWTFFAGWAAWVDFHPASWAHWGLVITSIYLTVAGIAQQIIPDRSVNRVT